MNKLDYLAQKEEELRRLNEQLDQRQQSALADPMADSLDMRTAKGNPFVEESKAQEEQEEVFRASTTSLIKEAKEVRASYQQQVTSDAPADYSDLHEKLREQEKTINF